jgi:hypothetical protein
MLNWDLKDVDKEKWGGWLYEDSNVIEFLFGEI